MSCDPCANARAFTAFCEFGKIDELDLFDGVLAQWHALGHPEGSA